MKKNIVYLMILFCSFAHATERDSLNGMNPFIRQMLLIEDDCDACGCSGSGGSMGFSSMLNSNFVGLRYFYQLYRSNDKLYSNSKWHDESFNTIQVWARIPLSENIQLSALVPYHFNSRKTDQRYENISGIGDLTLMGMYRIYENSKDSTFLVHTLQIGGGIKIPTGKYDASNNGSVNPSFQLGTGSWDYQLVSEYIVRHKGLGFNSMLNYILKTENRNKYRFGNQFNYAGTLFYLWKRNDFTIAPHLGGAGEVYGSNYQYEQKVRETSGSVFFGKIGIEVGRKKLSFGTNFMIPVNQNLTGGKVEANYRWSINLNYGL